MDADKLLKSLDVYDDYRPGALDYQRFDDGSLYMIPFQFELEFIWYNKALMQKPAFPCRSPSTTFPPCALPCGMPGSPPRSPSTDRTSGRWNATSRTSRSVKRDPISSRS